MDKYSRRRGRSTNREQATLDYEEKLKQFNNYSLAAVTNSLSRYGRLTDKSAALLSSNALAVSLFSVIIVFAVNSFTGYYEIYKYAIVAEVVLFVVFAQASFRENMRCLEDSGIMDVSARNEVYSTFVNEALLQSLNSMSIELINAWAINEKINKEKLDHYKDAMMYAKYMYFMAIMLLVTWPLAELTK